MIIYIIYIYLETVTSWIGTLMVHHGAFLIYIYIYIPCPVPSSIAQQQLDFWLPDVEYMVQGLPIQLLFPAHKNLEKNAPKINEQAKKQRNSEKHMDWSFCVVMKRNSMILWTQDCRHLSRKIHSFSGVLWFPCHGCRSELLSTWNRWGRGRSDWKQNRQKWRQLRYWSNGSDKSIGNCTWYFLRAPPATWRGRLCLWIASRFHYQENTSIETCGAWSWNHAWHPFASRIAEERILYISRFDSTHTSIWQSLECFHSSVQLWCIPVAYLEMQRQVDSSSLGIAVGLFSWTYRLVPRCNSHALFARLWHCWGPMGS